MTTSPAGGIAPLARRAIACLIDGAIAALIVTVGYAVTLATALPGLTQGNAAGRLGALLLGVGVTLLVALAWFVVFCVMQGGGGSIGQRIMKVRLVRADGGAPIGFGRALLRNIVFGLATAIIVGYFTPLFDGSGRFQGWHDKAVGAVMLDARGAASGSASSSPAPPTLATAAPAAPARPAAASFAPSATPVAPAAAPAAAPAVAVAPATVAPAAAEVDPHDVTVLSATTPAADAVPDQAMITVVPGVSPSVPAPAAPVVSGPEVVAPPRPPMPAAAPATVADALAQAPVAQPPVDEDDPEETRISIPGHRLQFVWDDGARATVSGRTLFGRNPAPEAGAIVVVVRDETLSLSKTHFEAAAEAAGGWVMDRHSTNGMTIVRDGVRIACPPGERVRIRLGDAIEIGDRIVTVGGYA